MPQSQIRLLKRKAQPFKIPIKLMTGTSQERSVESKDGNAVYSMAYTITPIIKMVSIAHFLDFTGTLVTVTGLDVTGFGTAGSFH